MTPSVTTPTATEPATAERRALAQLRTATGRFAVIAADHGDPLVEMLDGLGLPSTPDAQRAFKIALVDTIGRDASAKHPDLKGIFATNLFGAEGSASGLREAGKSGVKIVSFDAGPKQVKDLKDGVVQGLIAQKPADIGADGVQQAYNALNGKPVQKKIATGSVALTKDNLAENQQFVYKSTC